MPDRRSFIKKSGWAAAACTVPHYFMHPRTFGLGEGPKLSLAQWSLHRSLESGEVRAEDFAAIARNEYGFEAVEYVNSFYTAQGKDTAYWKEMRKRADDAGVKSLLIMVDGEGELGHPDPNARKQAVENHLKWIQAVGVLGGHAIRVNAFGHGDREVLKDSLIEGLGALADYGRQAGIHILIENHGLHTSDAHFMTGIIREVNDPFLGTLPDFGNWCLATEWGSTQHNTCTEVFDPSEGLALFLPFAKGVSAKSYAFDSAGHETLIDYPGLLAQVRNSGYDGYIGVEFEGEELSEPEGIRATKTLIEKVWKALGE